MGFVGYDALSTSISCAVITMSQAWRNVSTSKDPSSWLKNFIRFSEARLHAVSSRKTNSEHGLDALIRPVAFTGFHRFVVVSYCMPGSPQTHAASEILAMRFRALYLWFGWPLKTSLVHQSPSFSTASMNSSVTRMEWF